jgi:hypothetical protein
MTKGARYALSLTRLQWHSFLCGPGSGVCQHPQDHFSTYTHIGYR